MLFSQKTLKTTIYSITNLRLFKVLNYDWSVKYKILKILGFFKLKTHKLLRFY